MPVGIDVMSYGKNNSRSKGNVKTAIYHLIAEQALMTFLIEVEDMYSIIADKTKPSYYIHLMFIPHTHTICVYTHMCVGPVVKVSLRTKYLLSNNTKSQSLMNRKTSTLYHN